tara:strand:+ start:176 stop:970 length:795 start_codon:yes stop_codon:yes gene_type:complete
LQTSGLILFDIDGVLRDVTKSYRLCVQKTVLKFCDWEPSTCDIDELKNEGIWNNDWDLTLELIERFFKENKLSLKPPSRNTVINNFEKLYFGCNPNENYKKWSGFINNEKLLVDKNFFDFLNLNKIKWGFVSGAERPSAKYILENRLSLNNPPLIAMEDAPSKPNPEGFLRLAHMLLKEDFGLNCSPVAYVGDTIADIQTIINARELYPSQKFISIGVTPPHLRNSENIEKKLKYESGLKAAGADFIIESVIDIKKIQKKLFQI